jgi:hypothetical protein
MPEQVQTFKNHAKTVPLYHYFVLPLLTLDLLWTGRAAVQAPGTGTIIAFATACALLVLAFFVRVFALRVQDRVIRLEMRLRLRELLPASLHPRITEFTPGQLVALRFASDAELVGLAEAVLRDRISDKKTIKSMIKDWNPDHARI